jgi:hypothetical protein
MLRILSTAFLFFISFGVFGEGSYPHAVDGARSYSNADDIQDEEIQYHISNIGASYQALHCAKNSEECKNNNEAYQKIGNDNLLLDSLNKSLMADWETKSKGVCKFKSSDIKIDSYVKNTDPENKKVLLDYHRERIVCYGSLLEGLDYVSKDKNKISSSYVGILQYLENAQLSSEKISKQMAFHQAGEEKLQQGLELTRSEKAVADADGNITTDKIWFSQIFLGEKFSSKYDENGKNKGFQPNNFYGSFTLDTRWEFPNISGVALTPFQFKSWFERNGLGHGWALIPGVNVKFYSADIVNCDLLASDEEKLKCKEGVNKNSTVTELKFNDISDVVDASMHLWAPFYLNSDKSVDVALGLRTGTFSRKNLDSKGSSLNSYNAAAIRFDYNDFFQAGNENIKNGMPRFSLEYAYTKMGDYANIGKSTRHIITGNFRIIEDKPIYLGLEVNKGNGPDSVSLTLSYGLKIENLLPRF